MFHVEQLSDIQIIIIFAYDNYKLSYANKFSHVWKKNTERYKAVVQERVAKLMDEIDQINQQEDELFAGKDLPELGETSQIRSEQVGEIAQNISDKLDQKQGQAKKSTLKKFSEKMKKLLVEKENLELNGKFLDKS